MFNDVSISLPAKVRGPEAEEEWQEVDWVTWSTGTVTVDSESFLIVFKPTGAGSVKAKPLGNMIRAAAVGGTDEKTLIVTTSESMHRTYRMTFPTSEEASEFSAIASRAEVAANDAAARTKETGDVESGDATRLESEIRAHFVERCPLVFGGAELYGPDPNGEASSEVLLGRGVMMILDPQEDNKRVGSYELAFFSEDEGVDKPTLSFAIAPEMTLSRQDADEEADSDAPVTFVLQAPTMAAHSVCFEDQTTATSFSRDFKVRSKLMDLSLKTLRGRAVAQGLRGELTSLKQRSLASRIWTMLSWGLLIAVLMVAGRAVHLYSENSQRPPAEYVSVIGQDLANTALLSASTTTAVGAKVCGITFGTVDRDGLRQCTRATTVSGMRQCLDSLTGYAPVLGHSFHEGM